VSSVDGFHILANSTGAVIPVSPMGTIRKDNMQCIRWESNHFRDTYTRPRATLTGRQMEDPFLATVDKDRRDECCASSSFYSECQTMQFSKLCWLLLDYIIAGLVRPCPCALKLWAFEVCSQTTHLDLLFALQVHSKNRSVNDISFITCRTCT